MPRYPRRCTDESLSQGRDRVDRVRHQRSQREAAEDRKLRWIDYLQNSLNDGDFAVRDIAVELHANGLEDWQVFLANEEEDRAFVLLNKEQAKLRRHTSQATVWEPDIRRWRDLLTGRFVKPEFDWRTKDQKQKDQEEAQKQEDREETGDGWGDDSVEEQLPSPCESFQSSDETPYVAEKETQTAKPNAAPEDDDVSGWVRGALTALRNRLLRGNNLRASPVADTSAPPARSGERKESRAN